MSRIGKLPIILPDKVEAKVNGQFVEIKGPHGQLSRTISDSINIELVDRTLVLTRKNDSRIARQVYGLSRTLVNNMVVGVSQKFERQLELKGVGYRSQVRGKELVLNLGYSHPITIIPPEGVEVAVEANTKIIIRGIDKEMVGQLASTIRSKRPPEPYKGKGVLYQNEIVKRKVGKSGK
jgi:large subunit ribosomal protein L6